MYKNACGWISLFFLEKHENGIPGGNAASHFLNPIWAAYDEH